MTHRSRRRRAPARPAEPAYRAPNEDASRRVQIARVAELRQMWERYRTGAIGFSVPDAEVDDDDPVAAPDRARPDRGQQNGRLGAGASSRGAQPRGWEPAQTRGSTRGTGGGARRVHPGAETAGEPAGAGGQLGSVDIVFNPGRRVPVLARRRFRVGEPPSAGRPTQADERGHARDVPAAARGSAQGVHAPGSRGIHRSIAAGLRGSRPASRSRRRDPTPTFTTHPNGAGPTIPTTNHPRRRHRVDPSHAKVGHRRCHVAGMTSRPRPSSRRVSSNIRKRSLDPKPRRGG